MNLKHLSKSNQGLTKKVYQKGNKLTISPTILNRALRKEKRNQTIKGYET